MTGTHVEIERSFLLDGLPRLPDHAIRRRIEQGYLAASDATDATIEGRVRRATSESGAVTHTHTIKHGLGLIRSEIERVITPAEFDALWPTTTGRRIIKTRYCVPAGSIEWEIDAFDDFDIVLAEVELPNADFEVDIPAWLADRIVREVTEEPAYRNYSIAMRGLAGTG